MSRYIFELIRIIDVCIRNETIYVTYIILRRQSTKESPYRTLPFQDFELEKHLCRRLFTEFEAPAYFFIKR